MADRPITFSGPMVRALLNGTKTQTRRVMTSETAICRESAWEATKGDDGIWRIIADTPDLSGSVTPMLRIAVADRLYVREHWRTWGWNDDLSPSNLPAAVREAWREGVTYIADDESSGRNVPDGKFRQAMHMPKWASRLTVHVNDVRVQRLQDISLADCLAEGCPVDPDYRDTTADKSSPPMVLTGPAQWITPRGWYHQLWDDINGAGAWDRNPWVAAYTFTVEQVNIDQARFAA